MGGAPLPLAPSISVHTLTQRADFLRANAGFKVVTSSFLLRVVASPVPAHAARVGYTVSAKCGNAVVRNRIKRRYRAAVRALFPELAIAGYDYVLIGRTQAATLAWEVLERDLRYALRKHAGSVKASHA